jgi:hypothetical protein
VDPTRLELVISAMRSQYDSLQLIPQVCRIPANKHIIYPVLFLRFQCIRPGCCTLLQVILGGSLLSPGLMSTGVESALSLMHEVIGLGFSRAHENNKEPTRELSPERERVLLQSISNQTHDQPLCSTPQRSEILSTMGRPHPPLKSVRGLGSEGLSKPGPGSHTLPRTDLPETITESKIWSFSESAAWRTLLATSSLTTSRAFSSFSGGKRSASRSRAWRAFVTTSGSGSSLRSISATIKKPQQIGQH